MTTAKPSLFPFPPKRLYTGANIPMRVNGKLVLSGEEMPDHPVPVMVTILERSEEATLSELGDYQPRLADYEDRLTRGEIRWQ